MSTIAAIATPHVPCAIGIIRVSGAETAAVLDRVFRARNGRLAAEQTPRMMVFGEMLDTGGTVIDSGLCVRFSAGHSYTGEESAELYCHGSPVVLEEVLRALFAAGARQAGGGDFTKRAFLHGKMDLMQAEAVADIIDAETAGAARNAAAQLEGVLSRSVEAIYHTLMEVTSRFYAVVDYPDEDIEDLTREATVQALQEASARLQELSATFSRGQVLKNGIPTVLLGRPNTGKSSLLNALVGFDRAIVTDVPGTTRDTVEEKLTVGNTLLRLIDTAGIRCTEDAVEKIGVERTRDAAGKARLAILVLDRSAPLCAEDYAAMELARAVPRLVVAANKSDLPAAWEIASLPEAFAGALSVCAKTGEGVCALCAAIEEQFPEGDVPHGQLLTNARQAEAVRRALSFVEAARQSLAAGMTPDTVLTDAEAALGALGELNGKTVREDLVQTIFSRFCVGK